MRPERDAVVHRLLSLLGQEGLMALIEAYAGLRVYVPTTDRGQSALRAVLTERQLLALAAHYGGEYLVVPLGREWRARIYREGGASYAAIAAKLGCTESAVAKLLRRGAPSLGVLPADPRQRRFPF